MKRIAIIIVVIVVGVAGLRFCDWHLTSGEEAPQQEAYQGVDSLPMLILQVQRCARLYTAEYRVHKIITHDDALRLKGSLFQKKFDIKMPLADRKIAMPMDAKLKAYIDFSEFSEQNVEKQGDKITILLPDPQVTMTSSRINQAHVREYVGLTRSEFSDAELAAFQTQGREAIIASIPEMGILESAKANAAKVLVPMLCEMGYREENITVAFRKEYGLQDLRTLLKVED